MCEPLDVHATHLYGRPPRRKHAVEHHITVLHEYNEIKDLVQSLMGQRWGHRAEEFIVVCGESVPPVLRGAE
jgi:hypothetical protein